MSNIPQAREILLAALSMTDVDEIKAEIETALTKMTRQPYSRKARTSSRPMSEGLIKDIRTYAGLNPDVPLQSIATIFNVNIGRVSEVVSGKQDGG